MKTIFFALTMIGVATFYCACDEHEHSDGHSHADGGHHSTIASCNDIIQACHEYDQGEPGPINDCHSKAHDPKVTAADCDQIKSNCLAVCAAAAADAGPDGQ